MGTGKVQPIGAAKQGGPGQPAWSPDGVYIAFELNDGLHLATADGRTIKELVPGSRDAAPGSPAWSPDGQKIAFHVMDLSGERAPELHVINVDGTGRQKLAEGSWPVWPRIPSDTKAPAVQE